MWSASAAWPSGTGSHEPGRAAHDGRGRGGGDSRSGRLAAPGQAPAALGTARQPARSRTGPAGAGAVPGADCDGGGGFGRGIAPRGARSRARGSTTATKTRSNRGGRVSARIARRCGRPRARGAAIKNGGKWLPAHGSGFSAQYAHACARPRARGFCGQYARASAHARGRDQRSFRASTHAGALSRAKDAARETGWNWLPHPPRLSFCALRTCARPRVEAAPVFEPLRTQVRAPSRPSLASDPRRFQTVENGRHLLVP